MWAESNQSSLSARLDGWAEQQDDQRRATQSDSPSVPVGDSCPLTDVQKRARTTYRSWVPTSSEGTVKSSSRGFFQAAAAGGGAAVEERIDPPWTKGVKWTPGATSDSLWHDGAASYFSLRCTSSHVSATPRSLNHSPKLFFFLSLTNSCSALSDALVPLDPPSPNQAFGSMLRLH